MTDIVERLRALAELLSPENTNSEAGLHIICEEAAAEIERLRNDAQIVPTRDQIYGVVLKELETRHPIPTTNFFAGRIADAILALSSARGASEHAAKQIDAVCDYLGGNIERLSRLLERDDWKPSRAHIEGARNAMAYADNALTQICLSLSSAQRGDAKDV